MRKPLKKFVKKGKLGKKKKEGTVKERRKGNNDHFSGRKNYRKSSRTQIKINQQENTQELTLSTLPSVGYTNRHELPYTYVFDIYIYTYVYLCSIRREKSCGKMNAGDSTPRRTIGDGGVTCKMFTPSQLFFSRKNVHYPQNNVLQLAHTIF